MIEQDRRDGGGKGNKSMIEIIREEESGDTKEKRGLPKDIKQIGKPDIGDRIYVEDQVYQFLHPYSGTEEKRAYVLLGRFENYAGRQCIFVEAAIFLEEIGFDGDLPLWNDQTWAYIYKQLRKEYDSMVIVGWAMDIKGQLPNMTARLEGLHQSNFGGTHQVLFLMDSLEREEAFYGSRNGHLYRREGYYVYYDKKNLGQHRESPSIELEPKREIEEPEEKEKWSIEETVDRVIETAVDRAIEEEDVTYKEEEQDILHRRNYRRQEGQDVLHRGNYRQQMEDAKERPLVSSYASTIFLALVVCTLGIMAYMNNKKMNDMQETLAQMNQSQTVSTEAATEGEVTAGTESPGKSEVKQPGVTVETVAGNVQKQEDGVAAAGEDVNSAVATGDGIAGAGVTAATTTDTTAAATTDAATATAATGEAAAGTGEAAAGTGVTAAGTASTGIVTAATGTTDATAGTAAGTSTATTESASAQAVTEAQTYLNQGYYIVQKGDSLVGICKKIYQTTAMMDKLCEVNGIEDKDAIYAGQKLILPN